MANIEKMNLNIKENTELRKALRIIWIFSVLFFLFIIISIIFVPEQLVLENIPVCESQKTGSECALCGSSRAFIEILKFNFSTAYNYNKGSIILFILLTINLLLYLYNSRFNIKNFKYKL